MISVICYYEQEACDGSAVHVRGMGCRRGGFLRAVRVMSVGLFLLEMVRLVQTKAN